MNFSPPGWPAAAGWLLAWIALGFLPPGKAAEPGAAEGSYCVVVSRATAADVGWARVVGGLITKHAARQPAVILHDGDVSTARDELREAFPTYVCFVATPAESTRQFVAAVHRLTRELDDDPYSDVLWGILTGFDAEGALAIARRAPPLTIRRVTSGTEVALDRVEAGIWFSELQQNRAVAKPSDGAPAEETAPDDTTAAIAARLNDGLTDLFVTSGHATERDWQIGYGFPNGSFRSHAGSLTGVNTSGRSTPIDSDNPKVWLPVGNCLAGHIDGPDSLALAFMESAGVVQMIGYTVPTWYGYGGWGCLDYFVEQPGRFTLAEAFIANDHALVHRLATFFPAAVAQSPAPGAMPGEFPPTAAGSAVGLSPHDGAGLLFDRDTVAFYGDPAWEARIADGPLAFEQSLQVTPDHDGSDRFTLEVWATEGPLSFVAGNRNGSQRGGRPIVAFLPHSIGPATIVEGSDQAPVITDTFVLLPRPAGEVDPAIPLRVVFRAKRARSKLLD